MTKNRIFSGLFLKKKLQKQFEQREREKKENLIRQREIEFEEKERKSFGGMVGMPYICRKIKQVIV